MLLLEMEEGNPQCPCIQNYTFGLAFSMPAFSLWSCNLAGTWTGCLQLYLPLQYMYLHGDHPGSCGRPQESPMQQGSTQIVAWRCSGGSLGAVAGKVVTQHKKTWTQLPCRPGQLHAAGTSFSLSMNLAQGG